MEVWHDFQRTAAQCIVLAGQLLREAWQCLEQCLSLRFQQRTWSANWNRADVPCSQVHFSLWLLGADFQTFGSKFGTQSWDISELENLSNSSLHSFTKNLKGWSDFECAAFGSVLAATDPVAVVGLLKASRCQSESLRPTSPLGCQHVSTSCFTSDLKLFWIERVWMFLD